MLRVGIGAAVIIVAGLSASAIYSALKARQLVDQARSIISEITSTPKHVLSANGRASTAQMIAKADSDVIEAQHTLDVSPGVWAMWALPYLHSQRQAAVNLLANVHTTAETGKQLLATVNQLAAASHGTTVAIPQLQQLHNEVAAARTRLYPLTQVPSGLLPQFPFLNHAVNAFNRQELHLTSLLSDGDQLTRYALTFLGANGPRTYFLAAENNAEMRDQGAVLSYALINAHNGTFDVGSDSSVGNIRLTSPAPVTMSPGMQAVFGSWNPTQTWQSTNATADYPWSGADMQAMYQQATGQHVDGVLALDVPGLAQLLKLVGPVSVPGISQPVTSANVSAILLHDLYVGAPVQSQAERRDLISTVARATVDKMKTEHVDIAAFANALAKDVAGRHLLAWDDSPTNEATITKFGGSGAVNTVDANRAFHVAVEDGSANKLDYYVRVSVSEQVLVMPDGSADVTTSVTSRNTAPAGQAPSYQLGPDNVNTSVPGQYIGLVFLWGPHGSTQYGSVGESGLRLSQTVENLLPQQSATQQFLTVIPHAVQQGRLTLAFIPQPRLTPDPLTVSVQAPGWNVGGSTDLTTTLTKNRIYSWTLSR